MNRKKLFKIFQLLSNDMAEFLPYFLIFYITCFVISIFNESWHTFFYWPAFHAFAIGFILISFFSETVRGLPDKKNGKINYSISSFFTNLFITFFYRIVKLFYKTHSLIIKNLTTKNIIKIILIIIVFILAILKNISVLDSMMIFYTLFVVFFWVESKISAWIVLLLFIVCSFSLVFKKNSLAQLSVVYLYYFLIITVTMQIKEVFLGNKNKKTKKHY